MHTTPSIDDLLEGIQASLQADVLPAVENPKAQAMLMMAQGVLQMVRQMLPVYEEGLVREHNGMTQVYRDLDAALARTTGPEAERVRQRAQDFAGRADYPAPIDRSELVEGHMALARGLVDTMKDLDVLQRAGDESADRALEIIRAHLAERVLAEVSAYVVGAGMVGRG